MNPINSKPFQISKQLVWEAWKMVKANAGSAGVDEEISHYRIYVPGVYFL